MTAHFLLTVAALFGLGVISGLTVLAGDRYLSRRRRPRPRPHVAHVQPRVPRAPEPATFLQGRVTASPLARRREP